MEANLRLDAPADARECGAAAAILHDLDLTSVRLLTNNPDKVRGLRVHELAVVRLPLAASATPTNLHYLRTKKHRMGHLLDEGDIS